MCRRAKAASAFEELHHHDLSAQQPNGVWCIDFLEDKTLSGAKLRILCVSDEFTRESLAIETSRSFRSERVCRLLQELISRHGAPGSLRMDNGPEFLALALRGLCYRTGINTCYRTDINTCYIEPGKPWQNGFAESFHARLRDEFLDGEVFFSVIDARVRLSSWRRDWNDERLHSSLAYVTPHQFAAEWTNELEIQGGTKAQPGS
jgi:putative transposase